MRRCYAVLGRPTTRRAALCRSYPPRSPRASSRASGGSAARRASGRSRPAARSATASGRRRSGGGGSAARARPGLETRRPSTARSSLDLVLGSSTRRATRAGRAPSSSSPDGAPRGRAVEYAWPVSSASSTSSSSTPAAFASSAIVGERSSCTSAPRSASRASRSAPGGRAERASPSPCRGSGA